MKCGSLIVSLTLCFLLIQEVILSCNEIRKTGAIAIAEAMENKTNLERLELDGNNLSTLAYEQTKCVHYLP